MPHFLSRTLFLLLAATLLVPSARTQAQAAPRPLVSSVHAGDTVRVWARSPAEQVGTVTVLGADTLGIRRLDGRAIAFPVVDLTHVDVQSGRQTSPGRVVVGLLLGGAVGAVGGGFLGMGLECASGCDGDYGGLAGFVYGGLLGSAVGLVTGGVLGAKLKVRRWVAVYP